MNRSDAIKAVLASGLFTVKDESYFTHNGCDVCVIETGKRLGSTVSDAEGFMSLEDARKGKGELVDFTICQECHCKILYGIE